MTSYSPLCLNDLTEKVLHGFGIVSPVVFMKKSIILTATACAALLLVTILSSHARDTPAVTGTAYEFASVRFTEHKTCIVWPGGKIENVFELSGKTKFDGWNEHYPQRLGLPHVLVDCRHGHYGPTWV
jgi:hypothetical protein